jgi:dipeptidyl aminopeptidase/acylaminoacyl peptidase
MPRFRFALVLVALAACGKRSSEPAPSPSPAPAAAAAPPAAPTTPSFSLVAERKALSTQYHGETDKAPPAPPPADVFMIVKYKAPLGENVAYASPVKDGAKRPAIVWIAGGFDWGVGDSWTPQPRNNDQSARAFRDAGIVLMMPALRGSNGNPGQNECGLGEVDDAIAAADYLASRPDVDPARIYLGGHSTGGTIAVLAAESTARFRAIFAFGPVHDVRAYGTCVPRQASDAEARPRSPLYFMADIATPTYLIEGESQGVSNAAALPVMKQAAKGAPVHAVAVPGLDHFSVIAPGTEVVAAAILADTGPAPTFAIDPAAILARAAAK